MIVEIPWADGSGDKIYLDFVTPSGTQVIKITSDINIKQNPRHKDILFTALDVSPVQLKITQDISGGIGFMVIGTNFYVFKG